MKRDFPKPKMIFIKYPMTSFIFFAFILSWPFLFYAYGFSNNILFRYIGASIGMLMVALSAFIIRFFAYNKDFFDVGWNIGKIKWYLYALGFGMIPWLIPSLIYLFLGRMKVNVNMDANQLLVVIMSLAGFSVLAGFGEEFGWRGFLLPKLLKRERNVTIALLKIGIVWGIWHIPIVLSPIMKMSVEGSLKTSFINSSTALSFVQLIGASILLSLIFGVIWLKTKSIFIVSVFHGYYIGFRDATQILFKFSLTTLPVLFMLFGFMMFIIILLKISPWLEKYDQMLKAEKD